MRLLCPMCRAERPAQAAPGSLCPRCAAQLGRPTAAPDPLVTASGERETELCAAELSRRLGRYVVIEPIGRGGMGRVYRARDERLDRTVAIKVLPRRPGDGELAERFRREARSLARLNHGHIVAVHEFGEAEGIFYLVMEHVPGPDLRQIAGGRPMDPARASRILLEVCSALEYAHGHGVIHRDIKPANILLSEEGAKVADFGLAKIVRDDAGAPELTGSRAMGTPYYMAPEQVLQPGDVDERADVYSLGVLLYELLTGALPVGGFEPPSRRAGVDAGFDGLLSAAMAARPEERTPSVAAFAEALRALAPPERATARRVRRRLLPRAVPGSGERAGRFWTSAAVVALATLAFTVWLQLREDGRARLARAVEFTRGASIEDRRTGIAELVRIAEHEPGHRLEALQRLAALVKARADWSAARATPADLRACAVCDIASDRGEPPGAAPRPPPDDVVDALRGLGARSADLDPRERRGLDLSMTDLCGLQERGLSLEDLDLRHANLAKAQLFGSSLRNARLTGARLLQARLPGADLSGARLDNACLRETVLIRADLTGALLRNACLDGAEMFGAILVDADLSGADLEHARDLTLEQLLDARWDERTRLPAGLDLHKLSKK